MQGFQVILAQVNPIQQNAPFCGVVKPGEQFDQGGFSGAIQPNQGDTLARGDNEVDVLKHHFIGSGILERNILEVNAFPDWCRRNFAVLRKSQHRLNL